MRLNMNTLLLAGAAYVGYKYFLHGNLSSIGGLLGGGGTTTSGSGTGGQALTGADMAYAKQLAIQFDVRGADGSDAITPGGGWHEIAAYRNANGAWPPSRDAALMWLVANGYYSWSQGWLK